MKLREMLAANKEPSAKLEELERKVCGRHQAISGLIGAIRGLMQSPDPRRRPIGFTAGPGKGRKG